MKIDPTGPGPEYVEAEILKDLEEKLDDIEDPEPKRRRRNY